MRPNLRLLWAVLLGGLLGGGVVEAKTYQVSDLATLQKLCAEEANPGDVIELQSGTYFLKTPCLSVTRSGEPGQPIIIRGVVTENARPVLDASKVNVRRGIFFTEEATHDVVFEDLDLCNAKGAAIAAQESFGHDAAGIYFQGKNLTARRLHSHHNENGWVATEQADNLLLESCEIDHNGTLFTGKRDLTGNIDAGARHQTIRNCYLHHSGDAQNFRSRGWHTVFAYNWVEEDAGDSLTLASGNAGNALWIGNLILKRKAPGGPRRLLVFGDGTGVAAGTLTLINNTFVSATEEDVFISTAANSTGHLVLLNNAFVGPGKTFLVHQGKGTVTGAHNWFRKGLKAPETLTDSLFGEDPGFAAFLGQPYRPFVDSALRNAGVVRPQFLGENQQLTDILPEGEPTVEWTKPLPRPSVDALDIGAFENRRPVEPPATTAAPPAPMPEFLK